MSLEKPFLGEHWKRRNGIGPEYIINGGDDWHKGPYKCTYELKMLPPGSAEVSFWLTYMALIEDYEPIEN